MSPTKVKENDQATKGPVTAMNNGSRPSPLKINKDSHSIHKPFDSGNILAVESQTKRQPVITYTHSPKIIHAKARDFRSLVQKLTGFSASSDLNTVQHKLKRMEDDLFSYEKDSATSVEGSTMYKWHDDNTYLHGGDIPMFTLNSNESFLCSSRANHLFKTWTLGG